MRYKREEVKEELTEEDLEKPVPISLMETDTIWLLDIIGVSVSLESEEAEHIKEQNEAYMAVSRVGYIWEREGGGGRSERRTEGPSIYGYIYC